MATQSEKKRRNLKKGREAAVKLKSSTNISNAELQKLIHELQVNQIELETQNDELRRTQLELEETRNKYINLYDFAPAGYFTLSERGIVLEANLTSASMMRVERGSLLRQHFSRYVAAENKDLFYIYLKKILENQMKQTCTLRMVRGDNTGFHAQLEGIGQTGHVRLAILDITQLVMAEATLEETIAQLAKKNRYESIIGAISHSIHQTIDLQIVLENAVDSMNRNIEKMDHIGIYVVEGEEAVLRAYRGYPRWFIERAGRIPYPKGFTWKAIIEGRPLYCKNADQDMVIGPAGKEMGTKSYLSMPINVEGKAIGTININSLEKNAFDEEELKLLEAVSEQITTAITNASQAETLRASEQRYRQLFDHVPTGLYRTTPDGRILLANPTLVHMLGFSSFEELAAYNLEETEIFQPRYQRDQFKQILEKKGEINGLESEWTTFDGNKIYVRENAKVVRAEDGKTLYYEGTTEDITERKIAEAALNESIAELSRRNRYETIIRTVIESVHKSINIKDVLENAVDAMIKNIEDVDNVFISLVEGRDAVLKAYRGFPTWFIERVRRIPYPSDTTWKTVLDGKPRYVPDVDQDKVLGPAAREAGTKSYLSMPIQLHGKAIGVININSLSKSAFDETDLHLLETVARQIEVAIANAKYADELRMSEERFRVLIEGVKDYAIFRLDTEGNITTWNTGAARIKGYQAEEILGKHFSIFYRDEDKQTGRPEHGLKMAAEEGTFEDEGLRVRQDGTLFWANVLITALRDATGRLLGFVKVTRDITERKQADVMLKQAKADLEVRVVERTRELAKTNEELKKEIAWNKWAEKTLRASEERYRSLYDENPSMYFTINKEGKVLSVNQFGADRLGVSTHELIGQSILKMVHEEDQDLALEKINECFNKMGEPVQWEFRKLRKGGTTLWVRESGRTIQNPDGGTVALIVSEDITDRKQMEEALYRHMEVLDLANDTIVIRDLNDIITYWNQGAEWTYGWTKEEALGKDVHELLQTEFPKPLEEIREIFHRDEYWEGELTQTKRDGTRVIMASRWTLQSAKQGNPLAILEISNDITERKRIDKTLRESQERFASFMRNLPGAAWIKDVEGRYVYANEIAQTIFSRTLDDLLGKTDNQIFDIDTAREFMENDRRVFTTKQSLQVIESIPQQDGIHYSIVSKFPIFDQKDAMTLIGGVAIDITELKNAESALKKQKDLYEAIINTQSDVGECFLVIENDRIVYSNKACEKISGYSLADLEALPSFFDLIVPEQRALIRKNLNRIILGHKGEERYQITVLHKNGKEIILEIAAHLVPADQQTQVIIIGRDITARKRAEEDLQKSEERLRIAIEGASIGNWDWNIETGQLDWSERCRAMFGLSPDSPLSYEVFLSALHPEDRARTDQAVQEAIANGTNYDIEYRTVWPDGSLHWIHARGLVIYDVYHKPKRMTGVVIDITQRRQAEEEIKTSLREKEILLKEIHHRVKNNLQIVSSLLNLQSRHVKDEFRDQFKESQNRIKSMALIHETLYQSGNLTGVDVAKYAKSLSKHLIRSYGADSSIRLKVDADNVLLGIDKSVPCGLIINELVSNSLKHAFSGEKDGEIRIVVRSENYSTDDTSRIRYDMVISDNGIGLPKDFDYRKTNSLGLQLVSALTKQIDGNIEVDTSRGTEFRITFRS
jgi:PAS domain S-box-containing protein